MGRIQSAAVLQRKATLAAAREKHYRDKVVTTANVVATVNKRPIDTYIYNSYSLTEVNGTSMVMRVNASAAAVTLFGGPTALGLVDPAGVSLSIAKKPKEFTPAQVHAMKGNTTPVASASPWGTRVIKYSTATGGGSQAHYVAPVSGDVTSTYKEVAQRAGAVHTAVRGQLGAEDYYRFWFSPEIINIQEN